jgi:hypothetical protein
MRGFNQINMVILNDGNILDKIKGWGKLEQTAVHAFSHSGKHG